MTKRIFHSITLVALIVFVTCIALFMGVLYDYFTDVQRQQLKSQTMLATQGINNEGLSYLDGFNDENFHITVIEPSGDIVYYSNADNGKSTDYMQNQEIIDAIEHGYGESKSNTSNPFERSLSSAMLLNDGSIIRLSVSQNTVLTLLLSMSHPLIVILFIAITLSLFLAHRLSKKIVQPLNELDLDNPLSNNEYEELSPLLKRIDAQQKKLRKRTEQFNRRQEEFNIITGNLNEGFILLNDAGKILSINSSASKLLGITKYNIGFDFLNINRNQKINQLVSESLKGLSGEEIIELSNEKYQLNVNPIISDNNISGAVILIFDVTDKKKSEQMRQEFTANVTHELKTPLQSISGYAELIKNDIVRPEDIKGFGRKIYSEAQRMIRLVEDIIHLSKLDEGAADMSRTEIDVYELAKSTVETLILEADFAEVSLEVGGESGIIHGIPQLVRGIIFNLCDNAIKYNRKNGRVDVLVENTPQGVKLTVKDTGIGIPDEDYDRIFERFYRVDKSHSKEVGGTGLGLSIVKHATKIHNAEIFLESSLGIGTTVSIVFPKNV